MYLFKDHCIKPPIYGLPPGSANIQAVILVATQLNAHCSQEHGDDEDDGLDNRLACHVIVVHGLTHVVP
jgi:hypothetical protein